MAPRKLVVTKYNEYLLSFVLDCDGKTVTIDASSAENTSMVGDICVGTVTDVVKSINGAFVEIGNGVKGFLHLNDKKEPYFLNSMRNPGPVRQGDVILAQVVTDPIKSKDASLSSEISIAGRYGVLVSNETGIKISNKIDKEQISPELIAAVNERLKESGLGYILRTASLGREAALILAELEKLIVKWQKLLMEAARKKKGILLHGDLDVISKIKNGLGNEFDEIVSDDIACYKLITSYLEHELPEEKECFRPYRDLKVPLSVCYSIEKRLLEALSKTVYLRSGGFLVIEPTEAMTVIDVNSGKSVSKRQPEKEYLEINLEAAREIARQIQLRNLSGIIIVDFINMKSKENNEILLKEMKQYLRQDPQKGAVVDITALGLMEITRKKVRRPLYEIVRI